MASLQEHAHDRASAILNGAIRFETGNKNAVLNGVLQEALETLETTVQSEEVQRKSFDVALSTLAGQGSDVEDPLSSAITRILSDSRGK